MTISIKPTASGSTIEQDGSTILTVDGSGNISAQNNFTATGHVLQVLQTVKSDTFSTNSTSWVDVTGLSVSITPTSSSSKIIIMCSIFHSGGVQTNNSLLRLVRGATPINFGSGSIGNRSAGFGLAQSANDANNGQTSCCIYLDSPATTASTTYKIQTLTNNGSGSGPSVINRTFSDADGNYSIRTSSNIIVMEIAG